MNKNHPDLMTWTPGDLVTGLWKPLNQKLDVVVRICKPSTHTVTWELRQGSQLDAWSTWCSVGNTRDPSSTKWKVSEGSRDRNKSPEKNLGCFPFKSK